MDCKPCGREMDLQMRNVCICHQIIWQLLMCASPVECYWDTPEHHLSLPRTHCAMAGCTHHWVRIRYDDAEQNSSVLVTGILLWLLRRWPQLVLDVDLAMGHPQWVRDYECSFICLLSGVRLWLVIPSFIVLQLGKDLANSLNFAASAASKTQLKKTTWNCYLPLVLHITWYFTTLVSKEEHYILKDRDLFAPVQGDHFVHSESVTEYAIF